MEIVERYTKVSVIVFIVLGLGIVYTGSQVNDLQDRVNRLEWTVIGANITIDNGTDVRTKTVHLTRGATALEALNRVATVGTEVSSLGVFVTSIGGTSNIRENNMYWMFYTWEENKTKWVPIEKGVGSYRLIEGENFKASLEKVKW